MWTQKTICCTLGGTCCRLHRICSSSPSPCPVRLSPMCSRPLPWSLPKKMVSVRWAWPSNSTAETSRSTPLPVTSQPRPAVTLSKEFDDGRSSTAPLSIANATFCRFGAPGMTLRMIFPIVGSRTSMKCCPSCAGSSMTWKSHDPELDRTIVATTSTSSWLFSIAMRAISFSFRSSRMWIMPFRTSRRCPPLCAATTKTSIFTLPGSLFRPTQTTSSKPDFSPVCSSPE
mmetsp:Transcript_109225/g.308997  ORF Transcript_109225/g.308997 Transcript_109225/m.308997 type:complete len:229 (+) Transcript_109225:524-1210(+)